MPRAATGNDTVRVFWTLCWKVQNTLFFIYLRNSAQLHSESAFQIFDMDASRKNIQYTPPHSLPTARGK